MMLTQFILFIFIDYQIPADCTEFIVKNN